MDPSRDGGGGRTATGLLCGSCGTELAPNSKFCSECGTPRAQVTRPAEYKQVTVLFADVVHSMDIAAAVGSERLREIMAQLLGRATDVVQRYDGTVDKFTGDGMVEVPPQAGPPRTRAPTSSDRTGVLHREDRERVKCSDRAGLLPQLCREDFPAPCAVEFDFDDRAYLEFRSSEKAFAVCHRRSGDS